MLFLTRPIDSLPTFVASLPAELLRRSGSKARKEQSSCSSMVLNMVSLTCTPIFVRDFLLSLFIKFHCSLVYSFSLSSGFTNSSTILKSLALLIEVSKDHSLSHHDCLPYYLRTGDTWTPIDYSKPASHWMKPLVRGSETGLVEIPANWYLDDLPPMMFIKKAPNSHGWVNPKDVEELWRDHFDYFYREYNSFCFPVTIHPDVSGHPHVLLMLERLIEYISAKPGVQWVKMENICDDFKSAHPPVKGALLPAKYGDILKDGDVQLQTTC